MFLCNIVKRRKKRKKKRKKEEQTHEIPIRSVNDNTMTLSARDIKLN